MHLTLIKIGIIIHYAEIIALLVQFGSVLYLATLNRGVVIDILRYSATDHTFWMVTVSSKVNHLRGQERYCLFYLSSRQRQSLSISVILLKTVIQNWLFQNRLIPQKVISTSWCNCYIDSNFFFLSNKAMITVGALNKVSLRTVNESNAFSPVNDTSCDGSIITNIANGNFPANIHELL